MKKFNMFVITHKEVPVKLPKNYIPIQVGKQNTNLDLPYICDDTGDNISSKNANYCELTALYWLWKNYDLPDYVGICHYRRYFIDNLKSTFINEKEVNSILNNYDIVLPYQSSTNLTVYERYFNGSGKEKDLKKLRKIIVSKYSDYLEDYDSIMNSHSASYYNMFILSKNLFKKYCNWVFPLLFELENEIDLSKYSVQEARIYGYLSELLLNVWVKHNRLNVKYSYVYFNSESNIKNLISRIKISLKTVLKK